MSRTTGRGDQNGVDRWVLLAYRLPRAPSTPRIAVWRKLKRLGATQLVDGLVALPSDSRNREQLEWVAQEVLDAGGEATVWIGRPTLMGDERALQARMREAVASEYRSVAEAAAGAGDEEGAPSSRTLARLRRELYRIGQRDYFPPPERDEAVRAIEELAGKAKVRS